eukprot:365321-Chlamydomonas_euryale.AAC.6
MLVKRSAGRPTPTPICTARQRTQQATRAARSHHGGVMPTASSARRRHSMGPTPPPRKAPPRSSSKASARARPDWNDSLGQSDKFRLTSEQLVRAAAERRAGQRKGGGGAHGTTMPAVAGPHAGASGRGASCRQRLRVGRAIHALRVADEGAILAACLGCLRACDSCRQTWPPPACPCCTRSTSARSSACPRTASCLEKTTRRMVREHPQHA